MIMSESNAAGPRLTFRGAPMYMGGHILLQFGAVDRIVLTKWPNKSRCTFWRYSVDLTEAAIIFLIFALQAPVNVIHVFVKIAHSKAQNSGFFLIGSNITSILPQVNVRWETKWARRRWQLQTRCNMVSYLYNIFFHSRNFFFTNQFDEKIMNAKFMYWYAWVQ